jgi:hypothetical protein
MPDLIIDRVVGLNPTRLESAALAMISDSYTPALEFSSKKQDKEILTAVPSLATDKPIAAATAEPLLLLGKVPGPLGMGKGE